MSSRDPVDALIYAVCSVHDGHELWAHTRRDPEAFRAAVRAALGVLQAQTKQPEDGVMVGICVGCGARVYLRSGLIACETCDG